MLLLTILCISCTSTLGDEIGDDIYPCNVHTDYTPTVWAPTGTYTSVTFMPPPSPGPDDGSLVLFGGKGPHQGNVLVRDQDGSYGQIRSCDDSYSDSFNPGWCKYGSDFVWSCSEAEVVCRQLGYTGAESFSVNHKYGIAYERFKWKNVLCRGDEERLIDCEYEEDSAFSSQDGRIAGVSCLEGSEPTTIATTATTETTEITTHDPTNCPEGWLNADHLGCFLLVPNITVSNWYEAELVCEDLGGFVVEPRTVERQELVASLLAMLPEVAGERDWWIGLTDTGHEGSWVWVHDFALATEQFWASAPDSGPGNDADCALMSREDGYLWRDVECWGGEGQRGVLCQR